MIPAEQIRAIRHSTGLTQAAFASVFEIPKRSIENWEAGVRCPPPYLVRLLELAVKTFQPEDFGDITPEDKTEDPE